MSKKFPGIKGNRPDNGSYKREEAIKRTKEWSNLTPSEQLASLDKRLGKDVGALKQRARIAQLQATSKKHVEHVQHVPVTQEPKAAKLKAKDRRAIERGEK